MQAAVASAAPPVGCAAPARCRGAPAALEAGVAGRLDATAGQHAHDCPSGTVMLQPQPQPTPTLSLQHKQQQQQQQEQHQRQQQQQQQQQQHIQQAQQAWLQGCMSGLTPAASRGDRSRARAVNISAPSGPWGHCPTQSSDAMASIMSGAPTAAVSHLTTDTVQGGSGQRSGRMGSAGAAQLYQARMQQQQTDQPQVTLQQHMGQQQQRQQQQQQQQQVALELMLQQNRDLLQQMEERQAQQRLLIMQQQMSTSQQTIHVGITKHQQNQQQQEQQPPNAHVAVQPDLPKLSDSEGVTPSFKPGALKRAHSALSPCPSTSSGSALSKDTFNAVRSVMMRQQRVYVEQLFELHKICKMHRLAEYELQVAAEASSDIVEAPALELSRDTSAWQAWHAGAGRPPSHPVSEVHVSVAGMWSCPELPAPSPLAAPHVRCSATTSGVNSAAQVVSSVPGGSSESSVPRAGVPPQKTRAFGGDGLLHAGNPPPGSQPATGGTTPLAPQPQQLPMPTACTPCGTRAAGLAAAAPLLALPPLMVQRHKLDASGTLAESAPARRLDLARRFEHAKQVELTRQFEQAKQLERPQQQLVGREASGLPVDTGGQLLDGSDPLVDAGGQLSHADGQLGHSNGWAAVSVPLVSEPAAHDLPAKLLPSERGGMGAAHDAAAAGARSHSQPPPLALPPVDISAEWCAQHYAQQPRGQGAAVYGHCGRPPMANGDSAAASGFRRLPQQVPPGTAGERVGDAAAAARLDKLSGDSAQLHRQPCYQAGHVHGQPGHHGADTPRQPCYQIGEIPMPAFAPPPGAAPRAGRRSDRRSNQGSNRLSAGGNGRAGHTQRPRGSGGDTSGDGSDDGDGSGTENASKPAPTATQQLEQRPLSAGLSGAAGPGATYVHAREADVHSREVDVQTQEAVAAVSSVGLP